MSFRILAAVVAGYFVFVSHAQGEEPTDRETTATTIAKDRWRVIQSVLAGKENEFRDWSAIDWDNAVHRMFDCFRQMLKETPDTRATLKWYVDRFGEGGAVDDFAWMMAVEEYATPTSPGGKLFAAAPAARGRDDGRPCQIEFAEFQVKAFVRNRALLERYAYFLAWRNLWLNGNLNEWNQFARYLGQIADSFQPDDAEYWWHARQFLVVAFVTGRDDMIPAKIEDIPQLSKRLPEWLEWFRENGSYLRPSPCKPVWSVDRTLKESGYGYVKFFEGFGQLPEWVAKPNRPFPDWQGPDLSRNIGFIR